MDRAANTSQTIASFEAWLFGNPRYRVFLWAAAAVMVIQFAVFKYFYPYMSYIHGDSFSYLNAAYYNLRINTYMIGYSRFLRLVSVFTNSDTVLSLIQYLLIETGALYFVFTLYYFYRPGNVTRGVLLCFVVVNPLFLHLANLVSSDGIFLALSLAWLGTLLWVIHRPSNLVLFWHVLSLWGAFTVRYNALIYPLISITVALLSGLSWRKKTAAIGIIILTCGLFVGYTMSRYRKLTGNWQYSPFSGWQLANNAMYAYRFADSAEREFVSDRFRVLDNMIRAYFDSTRNTNMFPVEKTLASTYYMWSPAMPLMKYQDALFAKDSTAGELKKWACMGPFYRDYGLYIIRKYPWHFVRYFLWPNANKYYAPPVEFLESYNSGKDSVSTQAKLWFGYHSTKVGTRFGGNDVSMLDYYPILAGTLNAVLLCCLICFSLLKGWQTDRMFGRCVTLCGSFWLVNACFTIGASSAALRFQAFPILVAACLTGMILDWMLRVKMNRRPMVPAMTEAAGKMLHF